MSVLVQSVRRPPKPLLPLLTGAVAAVVMGLTACSVAGQSPAPTPRASTEHYGLAAVLTPAPNVPGNAESGRQVFTSQACPACHTLRGVPSASGTVGPNLTNMTLRPTIAGGVIQNTPENLARWISNAPSIKPGTGMPPFPNLTDQQTRDVAAFLYAVPYNPQ